MNMFGKLNPKGAFGLLGTDEGGTGLDSASLSAAGRELASYERLASEHKLLCEHLRAAFFASTFQHEGDVKTATFTDGEVLRVAAALYADDDLRRSLMLVNREEGRSDLDLGPHRDELLDRQPPPARWEEMPEPLRLLEVE